MVWCDRIAQDTLLEWLEDSYISVHLSLFIVFISFLTKNIQLKNKFELVLWDSFLGYSKIITSPIVYARTWTIFTYIFITHISIILPNWLFKTFGIYSDSMKKIELLFSNLKIDSTNIMPIKLFSFWQIKVFKLDHWILTFKFWLRWNQRLTQNFGLIIYQKNESEYVTLLCLDDIMLN